LCYRTVNGVFLTVVTDPNSYACFPTFTIPNVVESELETKYCERQAGIVKVIY